jgi:pimeloyl-ACP methyl ester carboxylesterase
VGTLDTQSPVPGEWEPMTPTIEPDLQPEPVSPGVLADPGSLAFRGRGSGRPVVFLHGQPGGSEIWSAVQDLLADTGVRTLALDRPGYGNTSLEAGGFRHNAEVLAEVLAQLGEPAVVVAHSWASGPALLTARRTPEMISGLVLCAPVGDRRSVTVLDRALAHGPLGRFVLGASLAVGGWLVHRPGGEHLLHAAGLGSLPPAEARSATQPALDRRARHAANVEQLALVEELAEVRRAARSVHAPTVVIGGNRDSVVRPEAVRGLARVMPHARLRMLDGGHLLPMEHPRAVADAVLGLLAPSPRPPVEGSDSADS